MSEEKDQLLAEFENPDISNPTPEKEVVEETTEAPLETVEPEPTPVETPEVPVENVEPAPVETPEAPSEVAEVDPAIEISKSTKESDDEPTLKKNIVFLLIIFILIVAFIIFLPTIISLLSGGSY